MTQPPDDVPVEDFEEQHRDVADAALEPEEAEPAVPLVDTDELERADAADAREPPLTVPSDDDDYDRAD